MTLTQAQGVHGQRLELGDWADLNFRISSLDPHWCGCDCLRPEFRGDPPMELTETRQIIREVLELVLEHQPSYGHAKYEAIFDSEHDRYQVLLSGWTGMKRSFNIVAQLDIVGRAV